MRLPPEVEERVVPKFDWIRLLERAPWPSRKPGAPAEPGLFTHELCRGRCERVHRQKGYTMQLSAAAIIHIGTALALRAEIDGTDAWLGIDHLAAATKRHRSTVVRALRHLEVKELLWVKYRGGELGIPRSWATVYVLTRPPAAALAVAGLGEEVTAVYEWLARPATASLAPAAALGPGPAR